MSKNQPKLYAAYGSNLNIRQMKCRCPGARLYKTGVLENYALEFRGAPDHAYATISPKEGASVPVAVWKISPQDERNLDFYEGYPNHYFKETVEVDLDGTKVDAMAYRMNLEAAFGLPSAVYYQTVRDGYRNCGLDTDALTEALKTSAHSFWESQANEPTKSDLDEAEPSYAQGGMQL